MGWVHNILVELLHICGDEVGLYPLEKAFRWNHWIHDLSFACFLGRRCRWRQVSSEILEPNQQPRQFSMPLRLDHNSCFHVFQSCRRVGRPVTMWVQSIHYIDDGTHNYRMLPMLDSACNYDLPMPLGRSTWLCPSTLSLLWPYLRLLRLIPGGRISILSTIQASSSPPVLRIKFTGVNSLGPVWMRAV